MRVADKVYYTLMQRQVQQSRKRLADASMVVSSGKKVNDMADDPLTLQRSMRNATEEANLDQYTSNQAHLTARYSLYEEQFNEAYDLLTNLKSVMVALSNPVNVDDAREELLNELKHTEEQLQAVVNAQDSGQYIFAGGRADQPAFDDLGIYQGDSLENQVEMLPNVNMDANITGERAFAGVGVDGGVNVFEVIANIRTMLETNPQEAALENLDGVAQAIEQVIQEQMRVGVGLSTLQSAEYTLENLKLSLVEKRQNFEDADYVTAITEYQAQEYALNASLQVNSDLLSRSLLDYLR